MVQIQRKVEQETSISTISIMTQKVASARGYKRKILNTMATLSTILDGLHLTAITGTIFIYNQQIQKRLKRISSLVRLNMVHKHMVQILHGLITRSEERR